MPTKFKFGDMICYRYLAGEPHDAPLMYVCPCSHDKWRVSGLIAILDITSAFTFPVERKDPSMWQRCTHLEDHDR